MGVRLTRIALALSLIVNVLLVAALWSYSSVEGVLSIVETAVGLLN